jgi:hypothetical protein
MRPGEVPEGDVVTEFARQIDAMSRAALTPMDLHQPERQETARAVPCPVCGAGADVTHGCPPYRARAAREHAGIRHTTTPDEET